MVRKEMAKTPIDERFGQLMMTIEEVAYLLNVHTSTVRNWNRCGLLKAYRLGPRGDRRFTEKDLLELLLNSTNETNGEDESTSN